MAIEQLLPRGGYPRATARQRALAQRLESQRLYSAWTILLTYAKAVLALAAVVGGLWWAAGALVQFSAQPNALQMTASGVSQVLAILPVTSIVTAGVAIGGIALTDKLRRRNARWERQRLTLASWLEKLYAFASAGPDERGRTDLDSALMNRHAIEFSLRRQDRCVASWMSEMGREVQRRRGQASLLLPSQAVLSEPLDDILDEIGESISAWHYRKLQTSDFDVPYTIRRRARLAGVDAHSYASTLGLEGFLSPARMTQSRRDRLIALVRQRPEVLDALDGAMLGTVFFDLHTEDYANRTARILRLNFLRGKLWASRDGKLASLLSGVDYLLERMGDSMESRLLGRPDK